jgi:putative ABC transport system substrate-binding protein
MRRRTALALIGSTSILPKAVHGQARMARIGLLGAAEFPPGTLDAFRDGMRQRGYVEGQGFTLDARRLEGAFDRDSETVPAMIARGADIIVAWTTQGSLAAKRATATLPIVMVSVGDPIGTGLVQSLARPGGNVTGLSNLGRDLSAKQVELFRDAVPGLRRIGLVHNPRNPASIVQFEEAKTAFRHLPGLEAIDEATPDAQYAPAIARLAERGANGLFFVPDPSTIGNRAIIAERTLALRLPTMFQRRENVDAGGLMSYGADLVNMFRQSAGYVDRLLKGAKPADLPVAQPEKFELVLNRRTARALGLTLPAPVLARADDIID